MGQTRFCVSCGAVIAAEAPTCEECGAHQGGAKSTSALLVILIVVAVLFVLVIVGGLIAIVGPNVFRSLNNSEVARAKTQMANFSTSIRLYLIANRRLPQDLEELLEIDPQTGEAFLQAVPLDPWGNPYELRIIDGARKEYRIVSYGRDMVEGTEDDIVYPEPTQD